MRARGGQVAVYLVLALVAVTFLAMMNVGAFLAVRAKNRAMNAGDAAALAAARRQGELLNDIGRANIEHLKLLFDVTKAPDEIVRLCREIEDRQRHDCFLGPIDGIAAGNMFARDNGAEPDDGMLRILRQHVLDVREKYKGNPDLYPEPWEGAWDEYAEKLETAISEGIWAGPDNIDYLDAASGHILLKRQFYNAVAGRCWCWFHFNAQGLVEGYSSFRDWAPLPSASDDDRFRRCANCEIYSLHLKTVTGSAIQVFGRDWAMRLADKTAEDLDAAMPLLSDPAHVWFAFGDEWESWSGGRYKFSPEEFPIVGAVRQEYDVAGCAAVCRVRSHIQDVVTEGGGRDIEWTAAAKPFGTVDAGGGADAVTAMPSRLVTSAFSDVRLVPVDSVGGTEYATSDEAWMTHVREHLPRYLDSGPQALDGGCFYCAQLIDWEKPEVHEDGRRFLKNNSSSCRRPEGPGNARGGTPHGH